MEGARSAQMPLGVRESRAAARAALSADALVGFEVFGTIASVALSMPAPVSVPEVDGSSAATVATELLAGFATPLGADLSVAEEAGFCWGMSHQQTKAAMSAVARIRLKRFI